VVLELLFILNSARLNPYPDGFSIHQC